MIYWEHSDSYGQEVRVVVGVSLGEMVSKIKSFTAANLCSKATYTYIDGLSIFDILPENLTNDLDDGLHEHVELILE